MNTRTRTRIAHTFFELAQSRNIDKITVQDIAKGCGITRQSFYYHFQDIRAIIESVMKDYSLTLLNRSESRESLCEIVKVFVESIPEYAHVINALMDSVNEHARFMKLIQEAVHDYVKGVIEQKKLFSDLTVGELKTVTKFCMYALSGILIEYSRKSFDSRKLICHLCRIFAGEINFR